MGVYGKYYKPTMFALLHGISIKIIINLKGDVAMENYIVKFKMIVKRHCLLCSGSK